MRKNAIETRPQKNFLVPKRLPRAMPAMQYSGHMRICVLLVVISICLGRPSQDNAGANDAVTVTFTSQMRHELSPVLYSIFYETEINFGGEGGLYAEIVPNRDFETLGRGTVPPSAQELVASPSTPPPPPANPTDSLRLDPHEPAPDYTDFRPWSAIGGAALSLTNTTQPFKTNPTVLSVSWSQDRQQPNAGARPGVRNPGYWGMGLRAGVGYNVSMFARLGDGSATTATAYAGSVTAAAFFSDCQSKPVSTAANIAITGTNWQFMSAVLTPNTTTTQACLDIVFDDAQPDLHMSTQSTISRAASSQSVLLDSVSVMPLDAVAGIFRRDLFEALLPLRPGFMRTPGGNYLEGTGQRTKWDWKKTIGPRWARAGHYNSAWGYWVTDGLGAYELLLLAELLGTEAQMSVYTGYSMGQPYIAMNQSQVFAQDALDMIEFANGPSNSTYGSKRADAGHPPPFGLKRLEVGNEERLMGPGEYPDHYKLITSAIWSKYPDMIVVASGRWGGFQNASSNPCLNGQRCDMWDDHYYMSADDMARMTHQYDTYDRSWPDVFVGEYAASQGNKQSLQDAIGEAAFLLGFEANGDIVKASSFAPLFRNVNATIWAYDLINFDTLRWYGLPSYYVQKMLQDGKGHVVMESQVNDTAALTRVVVTRNSTDNAFTIKAVNYGPQDQTVSLVGPNISSSTPVTVTTLTSHDGPNAANTLDNPHAVVPTVSSATAGNVPVPAWSLVLVHVSHP